MGGAVAEAPWFNQSCQALMPPHLPQHWDEGGCYEGLQAAVMAEILARGGPVCGWGQGGAWPGRWKCGWSALILCCLPRG